MLLFTKHQITLVMRERTYGNLGWDKLGLQSDPEVKSPVFGKKPVLNSSCKSVATITAGSNSQIPMCPNCGPKTLKIYRDGQWYNKDGWAIQRWLCNRCGHRFSDKALKSIIRYLVLAKYAQKERKIWNQRE